RTASVCAYFGMAPPVEASTDAWQAGSRGSMAAFVSSAGMSAARGSSKGRALAERAVRRAPMAMLVAKRAEVPAFCQNLREGWPSIGQGGGTGFPPPLRGRDRERGAECTAFVSYLGLDKCSEPSLLNLRTRLVSHSVLCLHPSPCPSPTRGEGTVWRAPSQIARCDCGPLKVSAR